MNGYLLVAMHGDEQFGLKVAGKVQQDNNAVHVRIGHPEAVTKHVRYIESDLNRSFSSVHPTIESALAQNIMAEVTRLKPDYAIDVHCSSSDIGKIAIVAGINPKITYLAKALGMEAIVLMPEAVVKGSFIGAFPDIAISIEYGRNHRSDELAQDIANKIKYIKLKKQLAMTSIPIYEVFTTIDKSFEDLSLVKNLSYNNALKGYPFLAGPDTYPHIGGFLAKKLKNTALSVNG